MSADLASLPGDAPGPSGLKIEPVRGVRHLDAFVTTASGPFGVRPDGIEAFAGVGRAVGLDDPNRRRYLGSLDGRPVATSALFLAGGVAGIYVVATIREARRRGIGAAMTLAAMKDARDLGYRIAVLQASPMGRPVYRQLGFRDDFPISLYAARGDE